MRRIKELIIHCSDTPSSMDVGVDTIRKWHLERGWTDVGYHYVIRRDGSLEVGRPEEKIGAHCSGHNSNSIGVCLVGEGEYTEEQYDCLYHLICILKIKYKDSVIYPHNHFNQNKSCPMFDLGCFLSDRHINNGGIDWL